MKSEKAKSFIRENDFYFSIDGVTFQEARAMMKKDAIKAVELAEQEAEERMREKAIEAHRKVCFFRNLKDNTCANTATPCGEHSCYYMNYIIQKLTE